MRIIKITFFVYKIYKIGIYMLFKFEWYKKKNKHINTKMIWLISIHVAFLSSLSASLVIISEAEISPSLEQAPVTFVVVLKY